MEVLYKCVVTFMCEAARFCWWQKKIPHEAEIAKIVIFCVYLFVLLWFMQRNAEKKTKKLAQETSEDGKPIAFIVFLTIQRLSVQPEKWQIKDDRRKNGIWSIRHILVQINDDIRSRKTFSTGEFRSPLINTIIIIIVLNHEFECTILICN